MYDYFTKLILTNLRFYADLRHLVEAENSYKHQISLFLEEYAAYHNILSDVGSEIIHYE